MVAEILTAREQMHCHAHRHSTDQCSKQLDKWFNVKHCSAVPSTVRYFASRCCGIPKHRISGCSEHYTTKPLKLFRFIVLWRSYVIYTYLKYQNTYNIKHDIYLYKYILSPMKGQNSTAHRSTMTKSKKGPPNFSELPDNPDFAVLWTINVRKTTSLPLLCFPRAWQPRWEILISLR